MMYYKVLDVVEDEYKLLNLLTLERLSIHRHFVCTPLKVGNRLFYRNGQFCPDTQN